MTGEASSNPDISQLMANAARAEVAMNRLQDSVRVARRPIEPMPPGHFGKLAQQRCEAFTHDHTTPSRKCQRYARENVSGWHVCRQHARLIGKYGIREPETAQ